MLSNQAIEEFQQIYLDTFGKDLPFAEAAEQAHQMIRFLKFVFGYPLVSQAEDSKDE